MPEAPIYHAERIDQIADQLARGQITSDEAAHLIKVETGGLKRPTAAELLPPNIPVDPEALKQQLLNSSNPRDQEMAAHVPPGHPGIDYEDTAETVDHQPRGPRTSQGMVVPVHIERSTTG